MGDCLRRLSGDTAGTRSRRFGADAPRSLGFWLDRIPDSAKDAARHFADDLGSSADDVGAGIAILPRIERLFLRCLLIAQWEIQGGVHNAIGRNGDFNLGTVARILIGIVAHCLGSCAEPICPMEIGPGLAGSGLI